MALEILTGFLIALSLVWIGRHSSEKSMVKTWANGLLIAALIYVGFALWDKNWQWLPIEVAGVLIYGFFVWLAYKYQWWWIGLGWALHVVWDIVLHSGAQTAFVPSWYPGVCIGFDLVIAAYLLYSWSRHQSASL